MQYKPISLVDMDGTIVQYEQALLEDVRALTSYPEQAEITYRTGKRWFTCVAEMEAYHPLLEYRATLVKKQPNWWINLKPIEPALSFIRVLEDMGFQCHILTKGPRRNPAAWTEKVRWIDKHLGENYPINIVTNKELFYGKLLFDDWPAYCEKWLESRPRGLVIMPEASHNKYYSHDRVIKLNCNVDSSIAENLVPVVKVVKTFYEECCKNEDVRLKEMDKLIG